MTVLFDGDSEERLRHQIISERPQPLRKLLPDVPRDLATIVEKAVEKDPNGRYATAIMRTLWLSAVGTVVALVAFVLFSLRRERKAASSETPA